MRYNQSYFSKGWRCGLRVYYRRLIDECIYSWPQNLSNTLYLCEFSRDSWISQEHVGVDFSTQVLLVYHTCSILMRLCPAITRLATFWVRTALNRVTIDWLLLQSQRTPKHDAIIRNHDSTTRLSNKAAYTHTYQICFILEIPRFR